MNNTTPNYAYLAGALRSSLEFLAFDQTFFKIESVEKRMEYLKKISESANQSAINYENEFNQRLNKVS
jgi:hypothetical protein